MLGLTRDGNDIVPMPNYMQPPHVIIAQAAWKMIALQRQTSVILLARRDSEAIQRMPLPTWVPDWSDLAGELPNWVLESLNADPPAPVHDAGFTLRMSTLRKGGVILVRGRVVESIGAMVGHDKFHFEPLEGIRRPYDSSRWRSANGALSVLEQPRLIWTATDVLACLWDGLMVCHDPKHQLPPSLERMTPEQKAFVITELSLQANDPQEDAILSHYLKVLRKLQFRDQTVYEWVLFYRDQESSPPSDSVPSTPRSTSPTTYDESDSDTHVTSCASSPQASSELEVTAEHDPDLDLLSPSCDALVHRSDVDAISVENIRTFVETLAVDPPTKFDAVSTTHDKQLWANIHCGISAETRHTYGEPSESNHDVNLTDAAAKCLTGSLTRMERYHMKLVVTQARFRIVYDEARLGDLICVLENCPLPIVLRKGHWNELTYIGEGCWTYEDDNICRSRDAELCELLIR